MQRDRVAFIVYVDLDPVPGQMHSKESAQNIIRGILQERLGSYDPVISSAPARIQPQAFQEKK